MYWWWLTLYHISVDLFFFFKWDKNSIRKLKSLLLSLLFSLWLLKWKSSSLHSADATFVLLTCNLSVTMLIVLSLCESKPSHWPAQCHVGTQWCIYSVQIHGRALTCFIVHYVDLHQPCMGAEGRAGTTGRNRATVYLADFSLSAAHVATSLVRLHTWWIQSVCASYEWQCAWGMLASVKYLHTYWMHFHYLRTDSFSGVLYLGHCWVKYK